jgi:hypothetical protein
MSAVTAGDQLPICPGGCADGIWSFYNEQSSPPPGEMRESVDTFPALDLAGEPLTIPPGARLSEVYLGPEADGVRHREPSLASFHFDGRVYFVGARELLSKTRVMGD